VNIRIFSHLILTSVTLMLTAYVSAGVPRMVAFFPVETEVCPQGWSEYQPAKGYLIRGSDDNSRIGQQLGDPIPDATTPIHHHKVEAVYKFNMQSHPTWDGGKKRITSNSSTVLFMSDPSDGGMSYVQYLMCQENTPTANEPSLSIFLPKNSVQWFTGDRCPAGWQVEPNLIADGGRTILPLPRDATASAAGAVVNGKTLHGHNINLDPGHEYFAGMTVKATDDKGGWHPGITNSISTPNVRSMSVSGTSGERQGSGVQQPQVLIPFTYLRPCVKTGKTVNIAELPAGMGTFTKAFACPTGLNSVVSASGRFPLGLPQRQPGKPVPVSGTTFGSPPLTSEQLPSHQHHLSSQMVFSTISLRFEGIATEAIRGLEPGTSMFEGDSDFSPMVFPYVQLKFCRVPG